MMRREWNYFEIIYLSGWDDKWHNGIKWWDENNRNLLIDVFQGETDFLN